MGFVFGCAPPCFGCTVLLLKGLPKCCQAPVAREPGARSHLFVQSETRGATPNLLTWLAAVDSARRPGRLSCPRSGSSLDSTTVDLGPIWGSCLESAASTAQAMCCLGYADPTHSVLDL